MIDASGGLGYHWRAHHYMNSLWLPYRETVARWLSNWKTSSSCLVIFGSSAGYSIPPILLERFKNVTIVEPDWFSARLFRHRFPDVKVEVEYNPRMLTGLFSESLSSEVHDFLKAHSQSDILFSNVLGQLEFLRPRGMKAYLEKHKEMVLEGDRMSLLNQRLQDHNWASYHDLISTTCAPIHKNPPRPAELTPIESFNFEDFCAHFFSDKQLESAIQIVDHQTLSMSRFAPRDFTWWEISPGHHHLIAFESHTPEISKSENPAPNSAHQIKRASDNDPIAG